jgi:hypothetical protein
MLQAVSSFSHHYLLLMVIILSLEVLLEVLLEVKQPLAFLLLLHQHTSNRRYQEWVPFSSPKASTRRQQSQAHRHPSI